MTDQFLKPKHDITLFSGQSKNVNSLFDAETVPGISAGVAAHGTGIAQASGYLPGRHTYLPQYSAGMVPSGGTAITGWTHHFYIALEGTPHAHLMAFDTDTVSSYFETSFWSAINDPF